MRAALDALHHIMVDEQQRKANHSAVQLLREKETESSKKGRGRNRRKKKNSFHDVLCRKVLVSAEGAGEGEGCWGSAGSSAKPTAAAASLSVVTFPLTLTHPDGDKLSDCAQVDGWRAGRECAASWEENSEDEDLQVAGAHITKIVDKHCGNDGSESVTTRVAASA